MLFTKNKQSQAKIEQAATSEAKFNVSKTSMLSNGKPRKYASNIKQKDDNIVTTGKYSQIVPEQSPTEN
jgi:hypothetical protein